MYTKWTQTLHNPLHASSNRLVFVFGGADLPSNIIPYRYDEILMHIDAQRRHNVEGPFDDEVNRILAEAENEICWIDRT